MNLSRCRVGWCRGRRRAGDLRRRSRHHRWFPDGDRRQPAVRRPVERVAGRSEPHLPGLRQPDRHAGRNHHLHGHDHRCERLRGRRRSHRDRRHPGGTASGRQHRHARDGDRPGAAEPTIWSSTGRRPAAPRSTIACGAPTIATSPLRVTTSAPVRPTRRFDSSARSRASAHRASIGSQRSTAPATRGRSSSDSLFWLALQRPLRSRRA